MTKQNSEVEVTVTVLDGTRFSTLANVYTFVILINRNYPNHQETRWKNFTWKILLMFRTMKISENKTLQLGEIHDSPCKSSCNLLSLGIVLALGIIEIASVCILRITKIWIHNIFLITIKRISARRQIKEWIIIQIGRSSYQKFGIMAHNISKSEGYVLSIMICSLL